MDDVMQDSVDELTEAVVGHRIVNVEQKSSQYEDYLALTLDNGKIVEVHDTGECCANTYVYEFIFNAAAVDHIITAVKVEDDYNTWHILADMEEVLNLDVGWSEGSGYYSYGFYINVKDAS